MISFHKMLTLNIDMFQLELKKKTVQNDDTIRVSVTTLPDMNKQKISFEAQNLRKAHPSFAINVSEKTEKILIVFRKKSFSDADPIIGSTIISKGEFPINFEDSANTELKLIDLYEPLQHLSIKGSNRQIIGRFYLHFSLTYEISNINSGFNQVLANNSKEENSKIDLYFNGGNNNNITFIYNSYTVN